MSLNVNELTKNDTFDFPLKTSPNCQNIRFSSNNYLLNCIFKIRHCIFNRPIQLDINVLKSLNNSWPKNFTQVEKHLNEIGKEKIKKVIFLLKIIFFHVKCSIKLNL